MRKISLSWLHILIVAITFIFTFAKGQDYILPDPILLQDQAPGVERPEIIAYQLVPGKDTVSYTHLRAHETDS